MNPLFNVLGGNQTMGLAGQFQGMVQQLQKFAQSFQGDPKAEVNKLLQSGAMNQQQLNQLQSMAYQVKNLMG